MEVLQWTIMVYFRQFIYVFAMTVDNWLMAEAWVAQFQQLPYSECSEVELVAVPLQQFFSSSTII
jgi:N6-adenosine-specific RNA methylase IME4